MSQNARNGQQLSKVSCSLFVLPFPRVILAAAPPRAWGGNMLFKRFGLFDTVQCESKLRSAENCNPKKIKGYYLDYWVWKPLKFLVACPAPSFRNEPRFTASLAVKRLLRSFVVQVILVHVVKVRQLDCFLLSWRLIKDRKNLNRTSALPCKARWLCCINVSHAVPPLTTQVILKKKIWNYHLKVENLHSGSSRRQDLFSVHRCRFSLNPMLQVPHKDTPAHSDGTSSFLESVRTHIAPRAVKTRGWQNTHNAHPHWLPSVCTLHVTKRPSGTRPSRCERWPRKLHYRRWKWWFVAKTGFDDETSTVKQ